MITIIDRPHQPVTRHIVYFIVRRDGGLAYIGKTNNLKNRVRQHNTDKRKILFEAFQQDRFYAYTVASFDTAAAALVAESDLIRIFDPELNTVKATVKL